MYELVSIHDHMRWQKILDLFQLSDIYYTSQYFLSALKLDPGEAFLFYYQEDEGEVIYPFIKRKISDGATPYYDITTPFGYGGPIINSKNNTAKLTADFRKVFSGFCAEENIIAEFIRFHPWRENAPLFRNHLKLIQIYDAYTINLEGRSSSAARMEEANGNPDQASGNQEISVKKLGTVRHMFEFLVLYYSAARRREDADSYYFFTNDYFEALISCLGPRIHLFGAYYKNKLVTACYVLTMGDAIYHHLEGSLNEPEEPEAAKSLLLKIAEWGDENYFTSFRLGGDYTGTPDPLKQVKREIADGEPLTFYIGHKIHDEAIYRELVSAEEIDIIKRYGNV